jgi:hypothetical protein
LKELGIRMTKATLRLREKKGEFPSRVTIGPHCIAWRASEVQAWMAGLPRGTQPKPQQLQQPQQVAA